MTVSVFFEKKKIGTGTAGRCVGVCVCRCMCVCVCYVTPIACSIREARRRAAEEGLRSSELFV